MPAPPSQMPAPLPAGLVPTGLVTKVEAKARPNKAAPAERPPPPPSDPPTEGATSKSAPARPTVTLTPRGGGDAVASNGSSSNGKGKGSSSGWQKVKEAKVEELDLERLALDTEPTFPMVLCHTYKCGTVAKWSRMLSKKIFDEMQDEAEDYTFKWHYTCEKCVMQQRNLPSLNAARAVITSVAAALVAAALVAEAASIAAATTGDHGGVKGDGEDQ